MSGPLLQRWACSAFHGASLLSEAESRTTASVAAANSAARIPGYLNLGRLPPDYGYPQLEAPGNPGCRPSAARGRNPANCIGRQHAQSPALTSCRLQYNLYQIDETTTGFLPPKMDRDMHLAVTRIRIALVQLEWVVPSLYPWDVRHLNIDLCPQILERARNSALFHLQALRHLTNAAEAFPPCTRAARTGPLSSPSKGLSGLRSCL